MSEFSRLTGVFVDPRPAFTDIAGRPRWIVPVVLLILVGLAFSFAMSSHIGWEQLIRRQLETNSRTQNLPLAQREGIIQQQARFVPILAYAGAVVGTPVYLLIVSGVMLLIFKLVLAQELTFKQVFSISAYSMLPGLLAAVVGMVVMFLKNPEDFDPEHPTIFNLGALCDPQTTSKGVLSLAASFDLFTIWVILLLAFGLSVASRRLSFGKSLAAAAAPWLAWVLVKAGLAALVG